jgi:hypothetical protein
MKQFSKQIILSMMTILLSWSATAQVGIGTNNPDNSAVLDIESTTKGLLAPRMTSAQRIAISTPAEGLIVFQTDNTPNLYCYVNGAWTAISSSPSAGLWTPVITDASGGSIPSGTATGFYQRVGNVVNFSGTISIPDGYYYLSIQASLPISSNFTHVTDASGSVSGSYFNNSWQGMYYYLSNSTLSGTIDADDANDKLKINVFNNVPENPDNAMPSNVNIGFSGSYIIK